MGGEGFEHCPKNPRKIESAKISGALSVAVEADSDDTGRSDDANLDYPTDSDLSAIIEAWDRLSPAVRRSLRSVAEAAAC